MSFRNVEKPDLFIMKFENKRQKVTESQRQYNQYFFYHKIDCCFSSTVKTFKIFHSLY